jgi:hypothetical protein
MVIDSTLNASALTPTTAAIGHRFAIVGDEFRAYTAFASCIA